MWEIFIPSVWIVSLKTNSNSWKQFTEFIRAVKIFYSNKLYAISTSFT